MDLNRRKRSEQRVKKTTLWLNPQSTHCKWFNLRALRDLRGVNCSFWDV